MDAGKGYTLPHLPYGYKALAPHISEVQLTLHHQKHHQAYVTGANAILEKLDKARPGADEPGRAAPLAVQGEPALRALARRAAVRPSRHHGPVAGLPARPARHGDFHQWIQFDLLYVRHASLWVDIKIILATLWTGGGKTNVPLEWILPAEALPSSRVIEHHRRDDDDTLMLRAS